MGFPFDAYLDAPFGELTSDDNADSAKLRQALGRDIYFNGSTQLTAKGDYKLVDGEENYRRGILRRLITSPGTYRLRPNYGAGVPDHLKRAMTKAVLDEMRQRIREQCMADRRTESVLDIDLTPTTRNNRPGLAIRVRVKALGRVLRPLAYHFSKEA